MYCASMGCLVLRPNVKAYNMDQQQTECKTAPKRDTFKAQH